jgi:hypothetical protein
MSPDAAHANEGQGVSVAEVLEALAARCEAGTGPDRGLDAAIGVTVGGFFLGEPRYPGAERRYGYVDSEGSRVEPGNGAADSLIPQYTGSLDAAVKLVPEGWTWSIPGFVKPWWDCRVVRIADGMVSLPLPQHCETPPLAICAAALRSAAAAARSGGVE